MSRDFFERWSQRKRAASIAAADQPAPADPAPSLTPEDIKALIDALPDVATLTADSDFSIFMQGWVPDDIKRDALRKLWTVDRSVLGHVPLADYALDYNTPGAAPGYGPLTATADMIAEVARIMGRAAFPEPKPETDSPPADMAAAVDDAGPAPLPHVVEHMRDDNLTEQARLSDNDGRQMAHDGAVREPVEVPQPLMPVRRRRHGLAAPKRVDI